MPIALVDRPTVFHFAPCRRARLQITVCNPVHAILQRTEDLTCAGPQQSRLRQHLWVNMSPNITHCQYHSSTCITSSCPAAEIPAFLRDGVLAHSCRSCRVILATLASRFRVFYCSLNGVWLRRGRCSRLTNLSSPSTRCVDLKLFLETESVWRSRTSLRKS